MTKTPQQTFEELTEGLPRFDDGRIDYTHASKAPVLNTVVYCNGEILLVKRSNKVLVYQGMWNGVTGFIDELLPIEDIAKQELSEEITLDESVIDAIKITSPYELEDPEVGRTWVVYPVLVVLTQKPVITLDWEHTDFAWINPADLKDYNFVKDYDKSVGIALALL